MQHMGIAMPLQELAEALLAIQVSSEQYTTISSSLLSEASASRMVAKWMEPGMRFAWNAHSRHVV
jgi:hypothetical protein